MARAVHWPALSRASSPATSMVDAVGSARMASAVFWPGASGSRTDAASTTAADIVRSVSISESWA
jgi:hypothetical protein